MLGWEEISNTSQVFNNSVEFHMAQLNACQFFPTSQTQWSCQARELRQAERGLNLWHVYLQTIRDMRAITIIPGVYILPSHHLNKLHPAWAF